MSKSHSSVQVREADLGDASDRAGVIDVLDSYASDPVGGGQALSAGVRERLVPMLGEQPNALVLLADAGGAPVGLAICFLGLSTFHARPLLNVHDLAVLPAWRGRGVGRALLTEAERRARARGCCKMTLEVQESNVTARRLYERFGFGDFTVQGKRLATLFLAKPLD